MTTVQPAHVSLRSRLTQPAIGAIVGLIVAALVLILWALNWFVGLRLGMTNAYFVPQTTSGHIVMVAIDDDSLAKYGALLGWSRQRYAELLNVFIEGDARVVAFDLLMSEPNSGDPRFVQALEAAKAAGVRTILPTVGVNRIASSGGVVQFENELRPLPQLESAAAYLAYVNAFPDADGVIRRSLSFGQQGESRRIAFSLAAYLSYYNVSPALAPQVIQIEGETIQFPTGVTLQMGQDGLWQQNYFGAATDLGGGTFPLISVRDVLNGTVAPSTFQDKIVLVGLVGATGAVDRYPTPISTPDLMSGLEIQANAIETLLQNRPLHPQSRWGQALAIVLCGVIGGVLFVSLRWYWALISGGLVLVGFLAYASSLFEAQLTVVNLLHPILTLGLTVVASLGVQISEEALLRRRAERLLKSLEQISRQRLEIRRIIPLVRADIQALTGAPSGAIWLAEEHSDLTLRGSWGSSTFLEEFSRLAAEGGRTERAGTSLAVPVVWQEKVTAVIAVTLRPQQRNIAGVQRQLERFAARLAPTLDNVQLYTQTQLQNQLLYAVLRESPAGILVLDETLHLLRVNQSVIGWLKAPNESDFTGRPIQALLEGSNIEKATATAFLQRFNERIAFQEKLKIGGRTYQWDAALLSESRLWVVTLNDINDLVELNQLKTRMIRMASHDLKNPLGRVIGYGELLIEDESLSDEQRNFVDRMIKSAEEMNQIITEILSLEHLRAGIDTTSPVNMGSVAHNVLQRYEDDLQSKRQTLVTEIPEKPAVVPGDFNQLVQAMSNLVGNAIKYTPEGGQIMLRLIPRERSLRLEVSDTGYGMPPDALPKLFTEFYRVRTEKTKNIKGTGLGLSLVKAVIEAHGGKIWVESELDKGTTFYVELPTTLAGLPSSS